MSSSRRWMVGALAVVGLALMCLGGAAVADGLPPGRGPAETRESAPWPHAACSDGSPAAAGASRAGRSPRAES